ncbi:MAG: hypothetical protein QOI63_1933, partial [Thermoplasmata archaeon]|nr:hypothetical protein [Thermoplasmata archaeon]
MQDSASVQRLEFHRHFALAWLLLACLTLPGDGAGQGGAAPAPSATLTVAKDTTWTHQDLSVAQDLEVLPPATLRLEGTHLRLGGRLEVRAGARLELAPRDGQATDIGPLDDAPATDTHGPWLWVNGTLAAAGLPRTNIHGLRGTGLNNLYFPGGGLLLAGHADLADVDLHDGNATLVVAPSGSARIRDSSLERMGYMGLGVLGQAALDNVTFRGSGSGLVGFQTCAIEARRIRIDAAREAVL